MKWSFAPRQGLPIFSVHNSFSEQAKHVSFTLLFTILWRTPLISTITFIFHFSFCVNFSHDLIKWCLNITISSSGVSGDSSQCQNANIRKQCLQSRQSWNVFSISSSDFGRVILTAVVPASRAFSIVLFSIFIVLFVTFWKSNVRYTVRTFFVLSHQASIFLRM